MSMDLMTLEWIAAAGLVLAPSAICNFAGASCAAEILAVNFQFIKHRVKMTGMPGFAGTRTDEEIWALVAFLNIAPGQSAAEFAQTTGMPPLATVSGAMKTGR